MGKAKKKRSPLEINTKSKSSAGRMQESNFIPRTTGSGRLAASSEMHDGVNGMGKNENGSNPLDARKLARGLAWFSIGLGAVQLLAPRAVANIAGLGKDNTGTVRLFGIRQIASGIGIFSQGENPSEAIWSRVAGDAMDLAALGAASSSAKSNKGKLALAATGVLAVGALDVLCAQNLNKNGAGESGTTVRKSLAINSTPEELYTFWRNFENLPRFMKDLESVKITSETTSHWVAKGPAGTNVEWDAEITEDRPNELISWRSLENADVDNSGTVRFEKAPGGRGTFVKVEMEYNPPAGIIGVAVAKLFGKEPGQAALESLRCFKQVMEVGEVVVSDGAVWDNGLLSQRPAQPIATEELAEKINSPVPGNLARAASKY